VIGDNVEIVVVDINREHVRLGIKAPRSVSVHRKEVYDTIQKEAQQDKHAKLPGHKPVTRHAAGEGGHYANGNHDDAAGG